MARRLARIAGLPSAARRRLRARRPSAQSAGMKWLDIPPAWLALALLAAWGLRGPRLFPRDWIAANRIAEGLGWALVAGGAALMIWAVLAMTRARTTPVPHRQPSALVTDGPFAWSRNPIYLGDAVVLLGAILIWSAPLALPVLAAFMWWIDRHFIAAEEARLRAGFGAAFEDWAGRVRRWI